MNCDRGSRFVEKTRRRFNAFNVTRTMNLSSKFYAVILLSLILAYCPCPASAASTWDYVGDQGVSKWPELFPNCAGRYQSPVNVTTTHLDKNLEEIQFVNYTMKMRKPELWNNGHTIQLTEAKSDSTISGGCLFNSVYEFRQLHFHWGAENDRGSEHLLDGVAYPMELHFVHSNKKYAKLEDAADHQDGLAVLGVFFKVTETDNDRLDPIIKNLDRISFKKNKTKLDGNDLILDDLLPRNREKFVCYDGSLTTPTCNEVVKWTVFYHPVSIGKKQLKVFRKMHFGESISSPFMVDNYRPVQDLNGRKIHLRDPDDGATINGVSSSLLVISALFCWTISNQ